MGFGRDWQSESKQRHYSIWSSRRSIFAGMETFVSCSCGINLILALILVREQQFLFFFFSNTHKKSQSLSSSGQTKSSGSLTFGCSPPAPEYCPLLFLFSSSAPSLPIIYSVLSDGSAKTLPQDTDPLPPTPPPPPCVSLQCNAVIKLQLSHSTVVFFLLLLFFAWHRPVRTTHWQPLTPTHQVRCLICSHSRCACEMEGEGGRKCLC